MTYETESRIYEDLAQAQDQRDFAENQGHALRIAVRRIFEDKDKRFIAGLMSGDFR